MHTYTYISHESLPYASALREISRGQLNVPCTIAILLIFENLSFYTQTFSKVSPLLNFPWKLSF